MRSSNCKLFLVVDGLPLLERVDSPIEIGVCKHVLIGNVDFLVVTLLVNLCNVLLSLLHKHSPDVQFVSQISSLLDLVGDERILREYLFLKKFL